MTLVRCRRLMETREEAIAIRCTWPLGCPSLALDDELIECVYHAKVVDEMIDPSEKFVRPSPFPRRRRPKEEPAAKAPRERRPLTAAELADPIFYDMVRELMRPGELAERIGGRRIA